MDIQKLIQEISQVMDDAIEQFNKGIVQSQSNLYAKLENLLKNEIETKGDIIRPSSKNYKLLGQLQNEIINTILNKEYVNSLKQYLAVHDVVAGLIDKYFTIMLDEFNPKANDALKKSLIQTTINSLTEAGIGINVADPIRDILSANITTGGSYASLTKQLRDTLLAGPDSEGLLQRYTKQITTDSIQQFNAEYVQALSSDLELEWFQYIGSNIVTTRDFCTHLTKKRWIHISEIPDILTGVIDGVEIPLNKQGLPYGMVKGTNETNFKIYRGGYNCRHQFYPVTEALVPENVKERIITISKNKVLKDLDTPIGKSVYLDLSGGLIPVLGELINRGKKVITNYEKKQLISLNGLEKKFSINGSNFYSTTNQRILPHELLTLKKIVESGHDVLFMPDGYFKRNENQFDAIVFNKNTYYTAEIKTLTSKNKQTIYDRLIEGNQQSRNIIVDFQNGINHRIISDALNNATNDSKINSIVVFYKNRKKTYFRRSILSKKFYKEFYSDFMK